MPTLGDARVVRYGSATSPTGFRGHTQRWDGTNWQPPVPVDAEPVTLATQVIRAEQDASVRMLEAFALWVGVSGSTTYRNALAAILVSRDHLEFRARLDAAMSLVKARAEANRMQAETKVTW